MALSTQDISQISALFNDGFSQIILPRLDGIEGRLDGIDERLNHLENGQNDLLKRFDDHVLENNKMYEDAYMSIGHYTNNTPTNSEFMRLKKRVKILESKHSS